MKRIIAIILLLCSFVCMAEVDILNYNEPYNDIYDWLEYGRGFEYYTGLDDLGRPSVAVAWICEDNLPEGKRIDPTYKPVGWHQKKYGNVWLYNRCHMIAWSLTAEANNECNLFTGTEQLNQDVMVEWEMKVLNVIKNGGEVLYRVTLEYVGNELICRSLRIEAVQLDKKGLKFHVRLYNVEDGITIDYLTGVNYER